MIRISRKSRFSNSPSRRSGNNKDEKSLSRHSSYKISRTLSTIRFNSSNSQSSVVDSKRAQGHNLSKHRKHTGLLFFLSLIIVLIIGWLIYQITAVVVVSLNDNRLSSTLDKTLYEKALTGYMDNNLISRLRIFADGDKMRQSLAKDYPEIKNIGDNGKISIFETNYQLAMRKPVAGWMINEKQYYVDSEGVSFQRNYYEGQLVQIVDESGVKADKNGLVASSRFLSFVGKLVSDVSDRGYEVTEVRLPNGTARQVNIKLRGVVPFIKLSVDRGVGIQVEDMDRALKYLLARQLNPEYIDLRVSGKAYYK